MPTKQQIEDAAKKTPANRTVAEQKMVDDASRVGNQAARNLDHAARETQRVRGRR
ncbi:MAG TPA: hypothetical protein VL362_02910 [Patescibacteria group bacterium]|jgi:hypothetical protein|nr:hypothetical protein [Patescibacteria group bacterium]